MWGSVSTAPPDNFIVPQQARHGNGWRVLAGRQYGFAEIHCTPEQYVVYKHATNDSSTAPNKPN
jgi:hypothetical protein